MDLTSVIAEMKKDPGFAANVGMVLAHNGIVRGWSRGDGAAISAIHVHSDQKKIAQIRYEIEQMEGVFKVVVDARSGIMQPGDDILFLVVAGDIREHVKPALDKLLDRIKAEGVTKKEIFVAGKP